MRVLSSILAILLVCWLPAFVLAQPIVNVIPEPAAATAQGINANATINRHITSTGAGSVIQEWCDDPASATCPTTVTRYRIKSVPGGLKFECMSSSNTECAISETIPDGTTSVTFIGDGAGGTTTCLTKGADGTFAFSTAESCGVLTGVRLNVEGSNNVITTLSYVTLYGASCSDGTNAVLMWDRAGTGDTAPTAACNDAGSIQTPSADFSGSAVNSMELSFPLPPGWTGNIDVKIRYVTVAASPTGNVEWDVSTVCRAVGESWDAAFNAVQTITDAVGAQNQRNDAIQTALTTTGCAAEEDFVVKISRDGVNDTNNDLAKFLYAIFTLRVAQ